MKKLISILMIMALFLCGCSSDKTKQTVTDNANNFLTALVDGNYEGAKSYVTEEKVLTDIGYTDLNKTLGDSIVSSFKTYTNLSSIEDYDSSLQEAIKAFSEKAMKALVTEYKLNDDFKKNGDEATISASVTYLGEKSNAFNLGYNAGTEYANDYLNKHPDFKAELQKEYQKSSQAFYKKYAEVIFTNFLNEKGDELFTSNFTDQTTNTWTITFTKTDGDKWVISKIES